jgi:hypothetical protein
VIRDPSLPHQIVLNFAGATGQIYVSCNCLGVRAGTGQVARWTPIETRRCWDAGDAITVYRRWHQERGIDLETQ